HDSVARLASRWIRAPGPVADLQRLLQSLRIVTRVSPTRNAPPATRTEDTAASRIPCSTPPRALSTLGQWGAARAVVAAGNERDGRHRIEQRRWDVVWRVHDR